MDIHRAIRPQTPTTSTEWRGSLGEDATKRQHPHEEYSLGTLRHIKEVEGSSSSGVVEEEEGFSSLQDHESVPLAETHKHTGRGVSFSSSSQPQHQRLVRRSSSHDTFNEKAVGRPGLAHRGSSRNRLMIPRSAEPERQDQAVVESFGQSPTSMHLSKVRTGSGSSIRTLQGGHHLVPTISHGSMGAAGRRERASTLTSHYSINTAGHVTVTDILGYEKRDLVDPAEGDPSLQKLQTVRNHERELVRCFVTMVLLQDLCTSQEPSKQRVPGGTVPCNGNAGKTRGPSVSNGNSSRIPSSSASKPSNSASGPSKSPGRILGAPSQGPKPKKHSLKIEESDKVSSRSPKEAQTARPSRVLGSTTSPSRSPRSSSSSPSHPHRRTGTQSGPGGSRLLNRVSSPTPLESDRSQSPDLGSQIIRGSSLSSSPSKEGPQSRAKTKRGAYGTVPLPQRKVNGVRSTQPGPSDTSNPHDDADKTKQGYSVTDPTRSSGTETVDPGKPDALTPFYVSPVHRKSLYPSFTDINALSDYAPWALKEQAGVAAHEVLIEAWIESPLAVESNVAGEVTQECHNDTKRWTRLEGFGGLVDLRRLLEISSDQIEQLPSNTLVMQFSLDPEKYFYLPMPDAEGTDHRNAERDRLGSSRLAQDVGSLRNSADLESLERIVSLSRILMESKSDVANLETRLDRLLDQDRHGQISKTISQREAWDDYLASQGSKVRKNNKDLRAQIQQKRDMLNKRQSVLAQAHDLTESLENHVEALDRSAGSERTSRKGYIADIVRRQARLVNIVDQIFPIVPLDPSSLLYSILDVPLPIPTDSRSPAPPLSVPSSLLPPGVKVDQDTTATALGLVAMCLQRLAHLLGEDLLYPVTCVSSMSFVRDNISVISGTRR